MKPKVCIVIVTWNKESDILNLLDSLRQLEYSNFETVVVDNASNDNTVKFIRERFPGVTLLENQKNLGGSGGFNTGLRYGLNKGFKYFWLLDNDVIVQPDALKQLVEVAEANPRYGQIGSKICYLNAPRTIQEIGAKINWHTGEGQPIKTGQPDQNISNIPFEVDYCAACSVLVRAEAVQQAGLMDERFFVFFDDKDFSQKIKSKGWQIVAAPASRVWHMFHSEKNIQPWRLYYSIRNAFYFFEKHTQGKKRWLVTTRLAISAVKKYFKYKFGRQPVLARIVILAIKDYYQNRFGFHDFAKINLTQSKKNKPALLPKEIDLLQPKKILIPPTNMQTVQDGFHQLKKLFPSAAIHLLAPVQRKNDFTELAFAKTIYFQESSGSKITALIKAWLGNYPFVLNTDNPTYFEILLTRTGIIPVNDSIRLIKTHPIIGLVKLLFLLIFGQIFGYLLGLILLLKSRTYD